MRRIIINNVKHIKELEFTLPATEGVHLIVGANGMGKTTLLTCLDRIANSMAFANGFKSANADTKIDQYDCAVITYETDESSVKFRKRSRCWASTPKAKSSELLKRKFGFRNLV